jgi:hypothetical protein
MIEFILSNWFISFVFVVWIPQTAVYKVKISIFEIKSLLSHCLTSLWCQLTKSTKISNCSVSCQTSKIITENRPQSSQIVCTMYWIDWNWSQWAWQVVEIRFVKITGERGQNHHLTLQFQSFYFSVHPNDLAK